jgi:hypothetical protein
LFRITAISCGTVTANIRKLAKDHKGYGSAASSACKWIYEIAISISGINLSNIEIISPRLHPSPFFRSKIVYGKD